MAESMQGLKRTHRCGELSAKNIGETVTVMGWVQKQRNKGGIIFVDMRDRAGILQVIFQESDCGAESFAKAEKLEKDRISRNTKNGKNSFCICRPGCTEPGHGQRRL